MEVQAVEVDVDDGTAKASATEDGARKRAATSELEGWSTFVTSLAPGSRQRLARRPSGALGVYRDSAGGWSDAWIGTMPHAAEWVDRSGSPGLRFADSCLRGVSQVFLVNNPLSGLVILAGLFAGSWWQAAQRTLKFPSVSSQETQRLWMWSISKSSVDSQTQHLLPNRSRMRFLFIAEVYRLGRSYSRHA